MKTATLGDLKAGTKFRFPGETGVYQVVEDNTGRPSVLIFDLQNFVKFLNSYGINNVRAAETVELV